MSSSSYRYFKKIIQQTEILKTPKRRLATFGETRINYFFLSEIQGFKDRSRLREGLVITEKPKILTPDFLRERFEGFGKDARAFNEWLSGVYGDSFRGLEYKFKNQTTTVHVEHSPIKILTEEIEKRLTEEESARSAVIRGPEQAWQIGLMKFVVDECMESYSSNMRELDEHGFFNTPEKNLMERENMVEDLFKKALSDRAFIPFLGSKLREFGLFKNYEDRFFGLMRRQ